MMKAQAREQVRCAVYTRKSTDEGLDKEFNSLDAQREAGEAYVASQRYKGWFCLPDRYDDGGYSGGNLNRPALARLRQDIADGKIDVVVVYKIDRLSRSLCDFSELFHDFERNHVEFVSVTQDINTSTSTGRMMLNILMSFAQYEREIITERIKDKVAAAKKKGMHTGGYPAIGYASDPKTHRLVVIPEQAELVRRIFEDYLRLGSVKQVCATLNAEGLRTPEWTSTKGRVHGGKEFTMAMMYDMLDNPVYIGKVRHYDQIYEGEQEAIISQELWDGVHSTLEGNRRAEGAQHILFTPMRGLIRCGHCGGFMKSSSTKRDKNRYYRYWVCDKDMRRSVSICPLKRAPADDLERIILEHAMSVLSRPELYAGLKRVMDECHPEANMTMETLRSAGGDLQEIWEYLYPIEKYKLIRSLVAEVRVFRDRIDIEYNVKGIGSLLKEQVESGGQGSSAASEKTVLKAGTLKLVELPGGNLLEVIPCSMRYNGRSTAVIETDGEKKLVPETMNPIQKALTQGLRFCAVMEGEEPPASLTALAAQTGMDRTFLYHSMEMANLAPDIQKAIVDGLVPRDLTLKRLRKGIPEAWVDQRKVFGFQNLPV